MTTKMF